MFKEPSDPNDNRIPQNELPNDRYEALGTLFFTVSEDKLQEWVQQELAERATPYDDKSREVWRATFSSSDYESSKRGSKVILNINDDRQVISISQIIYINDRTMPNQIQSYEFYAGLDPNGDVFAEFSFSFTPLDGDFLRKYGLRNLDFGEYINISSDEEYQIIQPKLSFWFNISKNGRQLGGVNIDPYLGVLPSDTIPHGQHPYDFFDDSDKEFPQSIFDSVNGWKVNYAATYSGAVFFVKGIDFTIQGQYLIAISDINRLLSMLEAPVLYPNIQHIPIIKAYISFKRGSDR